MQISLNKAKRWIISVSAIAVLMLIFLTPIPPRVIGAEAADDNAALYKAKCAMCHGADGSGNTNIGKSMKLRDLRSAEVQGQSDAALFDVIAKGKNKMPAYEKSLGADKCKGLVSFIRSLRPQP